MTEQHTDRFGRECPQCRYDLTGLTSECCPECGCNIVHVLQTDSRKELAAFVEPLESANLLLWVGCSAWLIPHVATFDRPAPEAAMMPAVLLLMTYVCCSVPSLTSRYASLEAGYRAVFARAALWTMLPWLSAAPLTWLCITSREIDTDRRGLAMGAIERNEVFETCSSMFALLYMTIIVLSIVRFAATFRRRLNSSPIRKWEIYRARIISVQYISAGLVLWGASAAIGFICVGSAIGW